jgi:glycosyltransferase involved in cell wall biosynthesis
MAVNEQNTISVSSQNSVQRRQRLLPRLVRQFYPLAEHIIGNSQGVAEDLLRVTGLPCDRVKIIYNPVVTPELGELKEAEVQHPWFDHGQPPVILAVGRLKPQKDFSTLIQAFARVRHTRPSRLLILGEGPERDALKTMVRELGLEEDVSLPGYVENPLAYMSRASLFVLSSRWEGLPTVLIEALYCGVPVISTDCPSGPREILADGQHGSLIPVQDVSALAEAINLGLNGQIPRPSRESWRPYELGVVVDQYTRLLVG